MMFLTSHVMSLGIDEEVLNRVCPGSVLQNFTHASVKALRAQLRATRLGEIFAAPPGHILQLEGVGEGEKARLLMLCERLRWQLSVLKDSRKLPTRNTFINFEVKASDHLRTSGRHFEGEPPEVTNGNEVMKSAPPKMEQVPFATKWPEHEELHFRKACSPCAYYFKPDSCRLGAQCEFCHLCPRGEIKARKKLKARALRLQERAGARPLARQAAARSFSTKAA